LRGFGSVSNTSANWWRRKAISSSPVDGKDEKARLEPGFWYTLKSGDEKR
jgi:hypothetical protein